MGRAHLGVEMGKALNWVTVGLFCVSLPMSHSTVAKVLSPPLVPISVAHWRSYWVDYTRAFIDDQGRVIDHHQHQDSTSEGESYALFFALVADKPEQFAKILSWTNNNLAAGQLGTQLPGWLWGQNPSGKWTLLSQHSAADADLWLAYTLIQAGKLWHRPDYMHLGLELTQTIVREEVVMISFSNRINDRSIHLSFTPMLLPGYFGFHIAAKRYVFNPSYLPLPLLLGLAQADPHGPWQQMASQLPDFLHAVSPHGFAPDWIGLDDGRSFFVPSQGVDGSYNAIRVYLWAGMATKEMPFGPEILAALSGMQKYLQQHNVPPLAADAATGQARGSGPVGFSAALLTYLSAKHDQIAFNRQLRRIQEAQIPSTGLLGEPAYYYDQNLALFALGNLSKSFTFERNGDLHTWWSHSGLHG
ncbi:cellulase [Acidithiobacillus sp. HP-6]|uniref:cellulose synthase complex periplasmic endoglucanase BcsZ n=1 Tax=unclassified Acidithiobacillus TaxID=2614800 RepID=UPI0018791F0D|nr:MULTISPECIES: cellulose synthase complex periplasmic endoglucanase BcsZ [unclassified Acidithiobacillus]MBE7562930.1 cellulase [Acidithiobacillus sp. HP-6]MBE7568145.1 cellulase [Acidithiobacillus sp. HP-2]